MREPPERPTDIQEDVMKIDRYNCDTIYISSEPDDLEVVSEEKFVRLN